MNKWNVGLIYKNEEEFNQDFLALNELKDSFVNFKNKLNNVKEIKEFFKLDEEVSKRITRLYVYQGLQFDQNQRDKAAHERRSKVMRLYNDIVEQTSFASTELVKLSDDEITNILKDDFLKDYDYFFKKLKKEQGHILDAKSEEIIAKYNSVINNLTDMYDLLSISDSSSVDVVLNDGETVTINQGNYRLYLENLENQEDRRKVFEAVFKYYDDHKNTYFGIYKSIVEASYVNMKNREYSSILNVYLDHNNIDKSVYLNLIDTAKENTDIIKEYYAIRKKFFNLDEIHTYDRFIKFADSKKEYNYEESKSIFFESIKSMPDEFRKNAEFVLAEGRVDVDAKDGKQSGAYSTHTYDHGPFIMLNHQNTINDLFTVVHEAGHSIHSVFSNDNQAFPKKDYVIFVAEIASTFNEQLLLDYLIKTSNDDDLKLVLLETAINNILGTFYRQSLFADYEYQVSKLREKNISLSEDKFSAIMSDLYMKYYDIDLSNEQYKDKIWAYIPHFFHSPFYVYQYATSFAASMQIYNDISEQKPMAMEKYLNLLKAGGSDYPINLVKEAGVDLSTKEPYLAVVKRLTQLVEELKVVLNNMNKL